MSLHDLFLLLVTRFLLPKCQPSFPCRNFTLEFPFTDATNPDCGMFVVYGCNATKSDHPTVDLHHRKSLYSILDKTSPNQLLIHDSELQKSAERRKCYVFSNAPPPSSPSISFKFASPNVTVFPCFNKSANGIIERQFRRYNRTDCAISTVYFQSPAPARARPVNVGWNDSFPCGVSYVPVKSGRSSASLFDLVAADYTLEWRVAEACYDCHYRRGGRCVTVEFNEFYCGTATSKCLESIQCGDRFSLEFPFTDRKNTACGLFMVDGCDYGIPIFHFGNSQYHMLEKISTNKFKVLNVFLSDRLRDRKCFPFINASLPVSPSVSFTISSNLTLFTCNNRTSNEDIEDHFINYSRFQSRQECGFPPPSVYYLYPTTDVFAAEGTHNIPSDCGVIQLPLDRKKGNSNNLLDILTAEFDLEWNVSKDCYECYRGGGQCLLNSRNQFHCKKAYSKCPPSYPCRNFTLQFPFTDSKDPDCGLFKVHGCSDGTIVDHPNITSGRSFYEILGKVSTNKFLVRNLELHMALSKRKCYSFSNMSLLHSPSVSFTFSPNLTFFTCYKNNATEGREKTLHNYSKVGCDVSTVFYKTPAAGETRIPPPPGCGVTQLPLKSENSSGELFDMLSSDFILEWSVSKACYECYHGGGQCLADNDNKFYCKQAQGITITKKILFIGGMAVSALASTLIILYVFIWRKREKTKQKYEKGIELFLKKNGNLAPMRYRYSSIKKMTNKFSVTLGKGGYGSVYKGQFADGHLVAVKLLNESNGDGEEFMNEVASISRTSHLNIVSLLGFCFEGPKRALIYDFMPNGSLEKFIGNAASAAPAESVLGWDKLFEIALGIARGLEYLHQGCNTRILHLDIKPQNILLDKDFNPRISDFGLAKLCPNRSSIVSMMVARGTIGYIAPEVFSRNFGEVSYKSDVYSYGMLVLEMAGGRKNIDPRDVDHTSEIYFPHYIYRQLEMDAQSRDLGGTVVEDDQGQVERNLTIVGLWCIQTNQKDRPSMTKVVEMLEGKHGSLEIPPKPYLYSPPRLPQISLSTSDSM